MDLFIETGPNIDTICNYVLIELMLDYQHERLAEDRYVLHAVDTYSVHYR